MLYRQLDLSPGLVCLMDGGGPISKEEVGRIRAITSKLIWAKKPSMGIMFLDKDMNQSGPFFKPNEDNCVFIVAGFHLVLAIVFNNFNVL